MKESSLWLRLGVWWLALTLIYWALALMGFGWTLDCLQACTAVVAQDSAWWVNLLGMVVPLGPNNMSYATLFLLKPIVLAFPTLSGVVTSAYGLITIAAGLTLALGIWGTRIIERALWRLSLHPALKVACNLAILLVLTLLADLALFGGHWVSLEILRQSL